MSRMFGVLGYSELVSSDTTHLVCGQNKRTVNLLKALLRGCWIITKVEFPIIMSTLLSLKGLLKFN